MSQHMSPGDSDPKGVHPGLRRRSHALLDQLPSGGTSTHTLGAYRRDLRGVADRMAAAQGLDDVSGLRLPQVGSAGLKAGMAAWATDHAPASVARA